MPLSSRVERETRRKKLLYNTTGTPAGVMSDHIGRLHCNPDWHLEVTPTLADVLCSFQLASRDGMKLKIWGKDELRLILDCSRM